MFINLGSDHYWRIYATIPDWVLAFPCPKNCRVPSLIAFSPYCPLTRRCSLNNATSLEAMVQIWQGASQAQRRAAIVALQADAPATSMPTAQDEILTRKQVAERFHRHASFVDRIVRRGRCAPRRELAVRWVQSLNLAPEIAFPELFDGEE